MNKNEQKGQCQTKLEQQGQCQTTKWAKQQQQRYGHALNEQTVCSLY